MNKHYPEVDITGTCECGHREDLHIGGANCHHTTGYHIYCPCTRFTCADTQRKVGEQVKVSWPCGDETVETITQVGKVIHSLDSYPHGSHWCADSWIVKEPTK